MELKVIDKRVGEQPPAEKPTIVEYAISKGATIEAIEKMWALQLQYEANEARKAYSKAMAEFKANAPEIVKDRLVDFETTKGRTSYAHASLANVTNAIAKAMSPYGLSHSFKTEQEKTIKVTCTITHRDGHSESTTLSAEPDTSGSKNSIQAIGSTVSYLERYTLLALTGLATADMDDDARKAAEVFITKEQATELTELIRDANYKDDGAAFLAWLKVETVDTLPAKEFKKAKAAINDVIKKRGGAK